MSFKEKFLLNNALQIRLENTLLYTFLVTIFLGVITFIPSSTIPFLYTKVSLFALGGIAVFVMYMLVHLLRGSIVLPKLFTTSILWFVPVAYGLSALFSNTPASVTVFGNVLESDTFGFILLAAFFGTLGTVLVRNRKQYKLFFWTGVALAAVVSILQIVLLAVPLFAQQYINSNITIVGSFYDLGILSGLAVIVTLFVYRFIDTTIRTKKILWIALLIELFFIAISNSTITWFLVAIIASALLVENGVQHWYFGKNTEEEPVKDIFSMPIEESRKDMAPSSKKARIGASVIVLIAALVFIISGSSMIPKIWSANNVRPSLQSTLSVGKQSFLFGSGPNTFSQEWLSFRDSRLNATQFWNTNFVNGVGFIPTSFVTTGIVGITAWVVFLLLFLFFGIRALIFRRTDDEELNATAFIVFAGAVYLLTELVFVVPGPSVIILGFVLAGVFISILKYFKPKKEKVLLFSSKTTNGLVVMISIVAAILISVLIAYFIVGNYIARVEMLRAQKALVSGDIQSADIAINKSLANIKTDSAYRTKTAVGIAYIQKIERDVKTPTKKTRERLQTALTQTIAAGIAATQLNPNSYDNWYSLGGAYKSVVSIGAPGAYKASVDAYKKAQKLNPTNPIVPFTLAQLSVSNKSYKDAETFLKETIALKKDYVPALLLYSQVEALLGKTKESLKAVESVVGFAPNSPIVLFQVGVLRQKNGDFNGAIKSLLKSVKLSPKYANARYFLAVAYAHNKEYSKALDQLKAIAAMSVNNEKSVSKAILVLKKGINPFVSNQQSPLVGKKTAKPLSGK